MLALDARGLIVTALTDVRLKSGNHHNGNPKRTLPLKSSEAGPAGKGSEAAAPESREPAINEQKETPADAGVFLFVVFVWSKNDLLPTPLFPLPAVYSDFEIGLGLGQRLAYP